MKHFWYNTVKIIVSVGLFFTHKKIKVYGKENIPKKGPLLFIGNHQNALLDAILIPTTTGSEDDTRSYPTSPFFDGAFILFRLEQTTENILIIILIKIKKSRKKFFYKCS